MNETLQNTKYRITRRELLLGGTSFLALGLAACGEIEGKPTPSTPPAEATPTQKPDLCAISGKEDLYDNDPDCIIEPQSN